MRGFFGSLVAFLIAGCSTLTDGLNDREILIRALVEESVFHEERKTVHVSHTCDLQVDGSRYPVVDIRELIPGVEVPRGINHIVVLDSKLRLVQKIEYTTERPLYCLKHRLFVYGDLMIDGLLPEGNLLTFTSGARQVTVSEVDIISK